MNGSEINELILDGETSIDFIVFETERLYLREFNADDADALFSYMCDSENTVYIDLKLESRDNVENYVLSRLKAQITSDRKIYDFAVCIRETGELIGTIGLFLTEDRLQAELGYILNKRFWANGLHRKPQKLCCVSASFPSIFTAYTHAATVRTPLPKR